MPALKRSASGPARLVRVCRLWSVRHQVQRSCLAALERHALSAALPIADLRRVVYVERNLDVARKKQISGRCQALQAKSRKTCEN